MLWRSLSVWEAQGGVLEERMASSQAVGAAGNAGAQICNPCGCFDTEGTQVKTNEAKNLFANERTFIHWVHM